jgi:2',3'-cyclic-nucleotide 2'-phosphodiesterase (5'-nucleotidase family)
MTKYFWYIMIGASLMACSARFTPTYQIQALRVQELPTAKGLEAQHYNLDKTLKPYQDTLHAEFDALVATAPQALVLSRPSSNLMNWCADAVLSSQTANKRMSEPVICLLNTGGLRSSFGAGPLTLADFYKLMPFDNRLVWIHLPVDKIADIEKYLSKSGGEPLANCSFENGRLQIPSLTKSHQYIWVLTSDFLANGGDQMSFFLGLEKEDTTILLREIFIEVAKTQGVLKLDAQPRYIK